MRDNRTNQDVARKRIEILFSEAALSSDVLAQRYVVLARRLSEKHRVRLSTLQKMCFCRNCNSYFRQGNYSKRLSSGRIVLTCKKCGFARKFVYK